MNLFLFMRICFYEDGRDNIPVLEYLRSKFGDNFDRPNVLVGLYDQINF
jgi:hypothetical protein